MAEYLVTDRDLAKLNCIWNTVLKNVAQHHCDGMRAREIETERLREELTAARNLADSRGIRLREIAAKLRQCYERVAEPEA